MFFCYDGCSIIRMTKDDESRIGALSSSGWISNREGKKTI